MLQLYNVLAVTFSVTAPGNRMYRVNWRTAYNEFSIGLNCTCFLSGENDLDVPASAYSWVTEENSFKLLLLESWQI